MNKPVSIGSCRQSSLACAKEWPERDIYNHDGSWFSIHKCVLLDVLA